MMKKEWMSTRPVLFRHAYNLQTWKDQVLALPVAKYCFKNQALPKKASSDRSNRFYQ